MNSLDLFDLVKKAQHGDTEAMSKIITSFKPIIKSVSRKSKLQDRNDVEQVLSERVIRAVISYDINSIPDFTTFCKRYCM